MLAYIKTTFFFLKSVKLYCMLNCFMNLCLWHYNINFNFIYDSLFNM